MLVSVATMLQKEMKCNNIGIVIKPNEVYLVIQGDYLIESKHKDPKIAIKQLADRIESNIEVNKLLSSFSSS